MKTKNLMTTLLGLLVFSFFCSHLVVTFLEKNGLSICQDYCENESSESADHCDIHSCCHSTVYSISTPWPLHHHLPSATITFSRLHQTPPDGPFFGIDYPPQNIG